MPKMFKMFKVQAIGGELMDKNQFVAEKLGVRWHIISSTTLEGHSLYCESCKEYLSDSAKQNGLYPRNIHTNPDFSSDAGAVELLRLMMGRPSWWEFISEAWGTRRDTFEDCFKIITTPGALLDAAAEHFGWKEGE